MIDIDFYVVYLRVYTRFINVILEPWIHFRT